MDPQKITKAKPVKKVKTAASRITDLVSWFLGSWAAVIFHTLWFAIWLILDFDVNLLTFSVSLEAIFIGIFLLMASNKAEIQRDLKEMKQQLRDRERMEHDIKLDEKADRQLTEIKHTQKLILAELKKIKTKIG